MDQEEQYICSVCNNPIKIGKNFCTSCGANLSVELPIPVQKEQLICPACGTPVKKGNMFCTSCGANLGVELPIPVKKEQLICPACGKPAKKGHMFCISCGTNLREPIKFEKISGVTKQLVISDEEKANLKQLFVLKNAKEIVRFIKNLFINYGQDPNLRIQIYDMIGEMLIEDPEFFINELYHRLYRKIVYRIRRILSAQDVFEMENYILKKFCFYEDEHIRASSYGGLSIGVYNIQGTFYITNRRLIVTGNIYKESAGGATGADAGVGVIEVIGSIYISIRGAKSPWKKILRKEIDETKPCFGYELPITDISDIQRKKKKINFVLKYEYEKNGQAIIKTPKLKFMPTRIYKYENRREFQERRERELSKINEVLLSISV